MFSDEILEKILTDKNVMSVPCEYKSIMLHTIEQILEDAKAGESDADNV